MPRYRVGEYEEMGMSVRESFWTSAFMISLEHRLNEPRAVSTWEYVKDNADIALKIFDDKFPEALKAEEDAQKRRDEMAEEEKPKPEPCELCNGSGKTYTGDAACPLCSGSGTE